MDPLGIICYYLPPLFPLKTIVACEQRDCSASEQWRDFARDSIQDNEVNFGFVGSFCWIFPCMSRCFSSDTESYVLLAFFEIKHSSCCLTLFRY